MLLSQAVFQSCCMLMQDVFPRSLMLFYLFIQPCTFLNVELVIQLLHRVDSAYPWVWGRFPSWKYEALCMDRALPSLGWPNFSVCAADLGAGTETEIHLRIFKADGLSCYCRGNSHFATSYYSHSSETQIDRCWVLKDGSEQTDGITKAPVFRGLKLWKQNKDCGDPASVQLGEMMQVQAHPPRPWNRPFLLIPMRGGAVHTSQVLRETRLCLCLLGFSLLLGHFPPSFLNKTSDFLQYFSNYVDHIRSMCVWEYTSTSKIKTKAM